MIVLSENHKFDITIWEAYNVVASSMGSYEQEIDAEIQ